MVKGLLRMLRKAIRNFGKPSYELHSSTTKLFEVDETLRENKSKRVELERRLKLLEIQSTPRGKIT